MRGRGDLALLLLALAVVIALSLARPQAQQQPSAYSSFDTGRNGYRAIYEVMRRERIPTRRYEAELGLLRAFSGTIVLSPNFFSSVSLDPSDAQRFELLARDGARVVVLGAADDALAKALAMPGERRIAATSSAVAVASALTRSVRRVTANFTAVFEGKRGARPLLLARGRPAAIAYSFGHGSVIAIAAPDVLSNVNLTAAQNAWFAYDVLGAQTPLLFDERPHGYAEGSSMWSVLPASVHDALWVALGVVLLAVAGGLFRSAPPVALEPPRERDSSAYLAAMASLLRRARAGGAAVEHFAADAQRLARQRHSVAARPEIATDLQALEAMQDTEHPKDAAVLTAARLYARLRKELAR